MRIAALGDNCIDIYDETGECYVGGNPVNVASYIQRLGGESAYVGAVGDDAYGVLVREKLEERGVDVSHLHVLSGRTAVTHVLLENGDRRFGEYVWSRKLITQIENPGKNMEIFRKVANQQRLRIRNVRLLS